MAQHVEEAPRSMRLVDVPKIAVEARVDLLASTPLFVDLDGDDLTALARELGELVVPAGVPIFELGDAGGEMYLVAEGDVNLHLPGDDSRRISLKDVGRGEYFGELALFDDKPRSASAVATTDAVLLSLRRETLAAYLQSRPQAAMVLLRTMAERLRDTNALLGQRAAKNAVEEIEKNLTWKDRLADRVAELNGSWSFIVFLLALTVGWAAVNSVELLHKPFDPYPYVFFNLVLAILVALQGPLIVMSQNRQSKKDRATAETDYQVNLKNEVNIETILRELGEMRSEVNGRLEKLENDKKN